MYSSQDIDYVFTSYIIGLVIDVIHCLRDRRKITEGKIKNMIEITDHTRTGNQVVLKETDWMTVIDTMRIAEGKYH